MVDSTFFAWEEMRERKGTEKGGYRRCPAVAIWDLANSRSCVSTRTSDSKRVSKRVTVATRSTLFGASDFENNL